MRTATRRSRRQRMIALALAATFPAAMLAAGGAQAQSNANAPTGANASRPARNPPEQTSLPSNAPPATTMQKTGATDQPPTVKAMNNEAAARTNKEGK